MNHLNYKITQLKTHIDPEVNVETMLYLNPLGVPCVRIRDLDAQENVTILKCRDMVQALAKFSEAVGAKAVA